MAEIEKIPFNGINVVSTFSGVGGSCLGYRIAGCRVVWANEFIPEAYECYRLNNPTTFINTADIRTVSVDDVIRQSKLGIGDIDLFDGSPPCSAFSVAGKKEKAWGSEQKYSSTSQRTDDLFFEYVRLVKGLQPKTFIAENVPGLVRGKAKGYFIEITNALAGAGYKVKSAILDAQWLGVPQRRKRLIFIGVRNDLGFDGIYPKPFTYRHTLKEVFPYLAAVQCGGEFMSEWVSPDRVMGTITQSDGSRTHRGRFKGTSGEVRKPTIAELKKICGFPDDLKLSGTFVQQWERLGRAVPPVMMRHACQPTISKLLSITG